MLRPRNLARDGGNSVIPQANNEQIRDTTVSLSFYILFLTNFYIAKGFMFSFSLRMIIVTHEDFQKSIRRNFATPTTTTRNTNTVVITPSSVRGKLLVRKRRRTMAELKTRTDDDSVEQKSVETLANLE